MAQRDDFGPGALLAAGLSHLGWTRQRSAMESGLAAHAHPGAWEICWLRRGRVDWWVDDQAFTVASGHCYITRPDEIHGAVQSVLEPCDLFWLGLRHGVLPEIETALRAAPRVFRGSALLADLWGDLLRQHRQPQAPLARMAAEAALNRLLVEIARCAHLSPPSRVLSPEIASAQAFAQEHLADEPAVAALARAAGLSASQFHARFADEVGEAPAEWMRRMRLDRARRRLAIGNEAITAIALDLGFPSSQYFATVFRRYTGTTPRAYREQSRGAPT